MKGSFNISGIFGKILLRVGLAAVLPLIAVVFFASHESYTIVSTESLRYAEELGEHYVNQINSVTHNYAGSVKTLATAFKTSGESTQMDRVHFVSNQLSNELTANPFIRAVWTQWESGALQTSGSEALSIRWHRIADKVIRADTPSISVEAYNAVKKRRTETIINPYSKSYSGKADDKEFVTSICAPILIGGEFKGVVGFDIPMSIYQKLIERVKPLSTGYAILVDNNGVRISHPILGNIGKVIADDLTAEQQTEVLNNIKKGNRFHLDKIAQLNGKMSRMFFTPLDEKSSGTWFLILILPLEEINEPSDRMLRTMILIGIGAAAVLILIIYRTARSISHPIGELMETTKQIAGGNLSVKLKYRGNDEIGNLASSFKIMAERLQSTLNSYDSAHVKLTRQNKQLRLTRNSLRMLNDELENKVSDRTADLSITLDNLKKAQNHISESEKMAILGQLVAGIAHELNTPLGAIKSSSAFILKTQSDRELAALYLFLSSLSKSDFDIFLKIITHGSGSDIILRQPSDRKKRIAATRRFTDAGLENPELLADDADTMDAYAFIDDIIRLAKRGRADVIRFAAQLIASLRAGLIIQSAADKASKTVSALVSYARSEPFEETVLIEPVKEIENILVIYYNRIKTGVTISSNYRCNDPVIGHRDRLNQVWINLINNALQAMDYKGTLSIETVRKGKHLVISFTNPGPQIPKSIRHLIFDPFFTTKKPGEGTGLGLDICRKIVEHHGGSISFASKPGKTTFSVFLEIAETPPNRKEA